MQPTTLNTECLAYAATRTAALPLPSHPYEGDESIGLLLLISHAAPFRPNVQAALRLVYGLDDGRRWPSNKAVRAADAPDLDVRRAKQRIDARLTAWQLSGDRSIAGEDLTNKR